MKKYLIKQIVVATPNHRAFKGKRYQVYWGKHEACLLDGFYGMPVYNEDARLLPRSVLNRHGCDTIKEAELWLNNYKFDNPDDDNWINGFEIFEVEI